jgi:hypothetical protein
MNVGQLRRILNEIPEERDEESVFTKDPGTGDVVELDCVMANICQGSGEHRVAFGPGIFVGNLFEPTPHAPLPVRTFLENLVENCPPVDGFTI